MTSPDQTDLSAAYALDALDLIEAAELEAAMEADSELVATVEGFQTVAGLLGELAAAGGPRPDVPVRLRDRVLGAATAVRPAATSQAPGRAEIAAPAAVLARTTAAFVATAAALEDRQWASPTGLGLTVGEVVAHLGAAFDYVAATVGASDEAAPAGPDVTHESYTAGAIAQAGAAAPAELRDRNRASLDRLVGWAERAGPSDLGRLVPYEGVEAPVSLAVIARAFEAWAHGEHVRRAVGQGPMALRGDELALLCDVAVSLLPVTYARAGHQATGRHLRLVLTGPGGGTYEATDGGEGAGAPPSAFAVVDSTDLCLVTGGLLDVDGALASVSGDEDFARELLGSLAVLAG